MSDCNNRKWKEVGGVSRVKFEKRGRLILRNREKCVWRREIGGLKENNGFGMFGVKDLGVFKIFWGEE